MAISREMQATHAQQVSAQIGFGSKTCLLRQNFFERSRARQARLRVLGTSVMAESTGAILDALSKFGPVNRYPDSSLDGYSSDSPHPYQTIGAVSGATESDGGGRDGMYETQLTKTLDNNHLWDAVYFEGATNNQPSSLANIQARIDAAVVAGEKAVSAGIYPIFGTMAPSSSSSPEYNRGYHLGMAIICEARGWGFLDTEFCTIDPKDGLNNSTYCRDAVHPNKLGRLRIGKVFERLLENGLDYSSIYLDRARPHSYTANAVVWGNWIDYGCNVDAAGAAVLTQWTSDASGGTPTVALASGDELESVVGGVVTIPRSSTTGNAGIRQDTPSSGVSIAAGDVMIVAFRAFGDTKSNDAQTDFATQELSGYSTNAVLSYQCDMDSDARNGIVRYETIMKNTIPPSTRMRTYLRNAPNSAGFTGEIKLAQISVLNKTQIISTLGIEGYLTP